MKGYGYSVGVDVAARKPSGVAIAPFPPGYFDDFSGASATITGRAVRDKAWSDSNGASPVVPGNPIITDGSGCITGNQGSLPANHMTTLDCSNFTEWWIRRRNNPGQAAIGFTIENADHVTQTGVNTWTKLGLIFAAAGLSGAVQWGYNNGGTATSSLTVIGATQQSSTQVVLGDTLETEYVLSGGNLVANGYHNGRLILSGLSLASFTGAKSGIHGFNGRLAATAGSLNVSAFEDIRIGDPNLHCMLRIVCPQRNVQRNADNSITPKLTLSYTKGPPQSLKLTMYNAATKAAVANATNLDATLTYVGGQVKAVWPNIAAVDIPATFIWQVAWSGAEVSGGATVYAHTPVLIVGEVTMITGQSLAQFQWSRTMTAGVPTAAGWNYEGSTVNNPLLINRKVLKAQTTLAGNAQSNMMKAIADGAGFSNLLAVSCVNGGYTGTIQHNRLGDANDTLGIMQAQLDAIALAGGDLYYYHNLGMQYEATGHAPAASTFDATEAAKLVADLLTENAVIAAAVGHAVVCVLYPVGWWGDSPYGQAPTQNASSELCRRTLWQICQDYPTKFVEGCPLYDLNHTIGDAYHLTDDGNGSAEQARRVGLMHSAYRFGTTTRLGPKMSALSRIDDHTLRVTYALGGATAVEAVNTGTEKNGGHRFSTASNFGSLKNATSVTVIDATTIEFGFAAATFPGTAYCSGPYGQNPLNPDNDQPTNDAMQASASMIRGTYADGISVAQRPYYSNVGGSPQDYLSAS